MAMVSSDGSANAASFSQHGVEARFVAIDREASNDPAIIIDHGHASNQQRSCERGNRYLDRSLLVETFAHAGVEFFA